jgi:TRAP-type C4-dicarboxylate transport system substrate-binding protein
MKTKSKMIATGSRAALAAAGIAALLAAGGGAATAAEVTLSMVHPFPDFLVYTKSCKAMVASINKAGAGVVQIDIKGGNEAIKMFQQPGAVSKGSVDLTCTPAAFYAQAIPENEAISTSNASPAHVRANGGLALIDGLHQKHFNLKYLGWIDSGPGFHIYMQDPPKFRADGLPDFTGVKMRDNPIYGAFFRALKATTHNMPSSEVYSALEKGVVNASAWTSIGLMGLKWDKFLHHRLDPKFYQTDIGVIMNLDRWKSLSPAAQKILQGTIIAHENSSRAARLAEVDGEVAQLKAGGMKLYDVPAAAKYLQIGLDSAYERMLGRLKERGRPTDAANKLRKLYQK